MKEAGRNLEKEYSWSPQLGPALALKVGLISAFSYCKATITQFEAGRRLSLSLSFCPSLHCSHVLLQYFLLSVHIPHHVHHGVRNVSTPPVSFEHVLTSPSKTSFGDSLFMFFALYLTTLFSMDTWAAARNSPYRAPGNNSFYRPATTAPAPGSYQAGMHGRGNAGPGSGGSGGNGGNVGRVPQARDSRPPMKLYGTAACGACMT